MVESQSADSTRVLKRMCSSMPCLRAVCVRYSRMSGPSAMFSGRVHGSKGKLNVKMSLSDRMPG